MKKVYLAGPTVFRENNAEVFESLKKIVREAGLEPLTPVDNSATRPLEIAFKNTDLIHECDYVVADLRPFRGTEPDSGTVFEVGFAIALNKRVLAYNVPEISYLEQVQRKLNLGEKKIDEQGFLIEDFDSPLNCMLMWTVDVRPTFRDCIESLRPYPC